MEDDKVIVFDLKSRTLSAGVILEVKGRNNYLVQVGDLVKHVSDDCITPNKSSQLEKNSTNVSVPVDENSEVQDLYGQEAMLEDDAVSVASDSTTSSIGVARPQGPWRNNYRNVRRNRRMMLERLGGPPTQNSRLRSGN